MIRARRSLLTQQAGVCTWSPSAGSMCCSRQDDEERPETLLALHGVGLPVFRMGKVSYLAREITDHEAIQGRFVFLGGWCPVAATQFEHIST